MAAHVSNAQAGVKRKARLHDPHSGNSYSGRTAPEHAPPADLSIACQTLPLTTATVTPASRVSTETLTEADNRRRQAAV